MYCDKENVNILTALLVRHGVKHVVVCLGSRNAPLAHNFNECPDLTCHSMTDERSAAFFALGIRQQTNTPVAVCVTSGSALLNTLPGTAEAAYQQQGIIIISADRPAAWIGQNDGQTLPQQNALGCFVEKSVSIPEPHNSEERWMCNRLINEAMIAHSMPHHPSVHINVPISEPLFSFSTPLLPEERVVKRIDWHNETERSSIMQFFCQAERRMIVVGQMPQDKALDNTLALMSEHAVVLSEPISCSSTHPVLTDQMIHAMGQDAASYHPECIIYIGGNTISKRLRAFLRSFDKATVQINISADGELHDISQNASFLLCASADSVISSMLCCMKQSDTADCYRMKWKNLQLDVRKKLEAYPTPYSQMMAVKEFEQRIADNAHAIYYANSMAIRLAALYAKGYRHCNRGLNGIEGSLSVAAGAAAAAAAGGCLKNTYCVIGDLSFFYDENALWQRSISPNLRIMMLNNGRGGIFGMLKGLKDSPAYHGIVNGQHSANAKGICEQFGVDYLCANDADSLMAGIDWLQQSANGKPMLLEVITNPETDEEVYTGFYKTLR